MKKEIKNDTILEKIVRPEKAKILKQVQDDMEVYRHCERMRSNPANYFARSADKVLSLLTSHFSRKIAFTLAEVLITLGIIGIVAAMTLPTLVQNYKKQEIEAKLAKVYSVMNNAIRMSEVDNGPKEYWYQDLKAATVGEEGPIAGTSDAQKWFNQYFAPYLRIAKQEFDSRGRLIVYFPDGSVIKMRFVDASREWIFYPKNFKKCDELGDKGIGKCSFVFLYYPTNPSTGNGTVGSDFKYHQGKGFEPYKYSWDGNISTLYSHTRYGCSKGNRSYCSAIIQLNGWKIPDDYPIKF